MLKKTVRIPIATRIGEKSHMTPPLFWMHRNAGSQKISPDIAGHYVLNKAPMAEQYARGMRMNLLAVKANREKSRFLEIFSTKTM